MTANPQAQRLLIALTQVLSLTVWFSVSAVVPSVQAEFDIGDATSVWLTGTVQLGFVLGALASTLLNLSDRVPMPVFLGCGAALAAACTFFVAVLDLGLAAVLVLRFLTGVFMAAVYPTGVKLMSSWSSSKERGAAMGLLLGALTLGSTLPHLIGGLVELPWRTVLLITVAIGAAGAVLAVTLVRPGPYASTSRITVNPGYIITMFRQRGPRLVNLGYFGHNWELYAIWTWLPIFVLHSPASPQFHGFDQVVMFLALGLLGFAGCLLGGWAADRFGRANTAVTALTISGACCLLSPLAFLAPAPLLAVFCGIWGASVIADSGVFSTAMTEVADPRFVGTALSAKMAIGFALTVVSIQVTAVVAELVGWQYAFLALVPGPVIGAIAMLKFRPQAVG